MQVDPDASEADIAAESADSVREGARPSTYGAAVPWALFLSASALLFLKSPDALLAPQFWAEDGAIFFNQQHRRIWPPLLDAYAGYLHFVPRLVAWLGSAFALEHQPLVYNAAAMLIDAAAITYVACRVRTIVPVPVVLLSFFVLPTAGDVFGTATNVQWFLQFAVFVACIRFPQDGDQVQPAWRRCGGAALLLAAALTGPFSLLALAAIGGAVAVFWLVGRGARVRAGRTGAGHDPTRLPGGVRWGAVLVVAMGAAAQVVTMLGSVVATPETAFLLPWELLAELGIPRQRHAYLSIVNDPWRLPHLVLAGFLLAGLAASLAIVFRYRTWLHAAMFGMVCMGAVQPLLAYAKQHAMHTLSSPSHYFYLWGVVSIWVVAGALQRRFSPRAWVIPAVMAAVLLVGLSRFPDYFRRGELARLDWPAHAQRIAASQGPTVVPLNPLPWYMLVQAPRAHQK